MTSVSCCIQIESVFITFLRLGLVSRDDSVVIASISPKIRLIIVYDVLYILGLAILFAVLLTTYLFRRIKRTPLWFMSVSSWGVLSFANVLLVGQQTGPQPHPHFCLAQAALIYASPALYAQSHGFHPLN